MDLNTMPQAGRPEPGSRHEVTVERVAALGRGVARLEGLTVLASRAIPGERVTVELEQVRPRHALGRVVAVHSPAPERVTPPCAHYAECGGCDWQHVAYPTQVIFKRQVLLEQLERIGGVSLPVAFTLHPAEPTLAYRDKLEFVPVSAAEGGVPRPGFAGLADQTRVAVDPCLLAPPEYTRLAAAALAALARAGMPDPMRTVRRLTVQGTLGADGAPALALTLHMADASALAAAGERREPLLEGLRQSGIAVALVGLSAPGRGQAGPMRRNLLGPEWLIKGLGDWRYRAPAGGFFQVHPAQAAPLVAHVTDAVAGGARPDNARGGPAEAQGNPGLVLDLYCGVGLFSLPLAALGVPVAGVEWDAGAVKAAVENEKTARKAGQIPKKVPLSFERRNLEQPEVFPRLVKRHGSPRVVLLDPPRRGLPESLIRALLAQGPERIVYVSCDGGTFARDAARLAARYRLEGLRGFDLFPHTHHLEVVGVFTLVPG